MSVFFQDIAEESWHKYLQWNQSVIMRVFQGQLKSTRICPKCNLVRRAITRHAGGKEGNQAPLIPCTRRTLTYMHSHLHTLSHIKLIHNHTHIHMYISLTITLTPLSSQHTSHTLTITPTPLSSQCTRYTLTGFQNL